MISCVRKKTVSAFLLVGILILPLSMVVGLSYMGVSHPLEGKKVRNTFFLPDSNHEMEIVFFGYVGCPEVCPTALAQMSKVLEAVNTDGEVAVGAVFVDINAGSRHQHPAQRYAQQFSPGIQGVSVSPDELKRLSEEFRLRFTQSDAGGGEIFHTDHFFLLKRHEEGWKIVRVLANQTDAAMMAEIITRQVRS